MTLYISGIGSSVHPPLGKVFLSNRRAKNLLSTKYSAWVVRRRSRIKSSVFSLNGSFLSHFSILVTSSDLKVSNYTTLMSSKIIQSSIMFVMGLNSVE